MYECKSGVKIFFNWVQFSSCVSASLSVFVLRFYVPSTLMRYF